jgi:tetratricopeptide (TPR) repeat protein
MTQRRFRVAFSFAGEQRDFVGEMATVLAKSFGEHAILYDKFHEAEFARYNLGIYLPKLYGEESDLIVPVLCPNYDVKRWTGWEWVHIYGLLTKADGHRVMPCRFGFASADGLSPAAGFIELDKKSAAEASILVLERLALNEGKPRDFYTKPGIATRPISTTIPNNLPRLQSFFGREQELRRIREALEPENRTWGALIDGPGGMGKTSLAIRAALDCSPEQVHRIVFVSVKERELDDDGLRQLGSFILPGLVEMLNELARELGQPEITKAPADQRIRLLLAALHSAQVLLILDNLESLPRADRDQLFTFVKRLPPGCKAILTSRRRIGSGSEELILERLDQDAALATLNDLARRNPLLARAGQAERIALYEQTGGKPLLLRWVAGQLGRGNCRSIADALAFLQTCPPENDPLEFIFGDLVQEFTDIEIKALCALAYFSLPAKVEHIVAATGAVETLKLRRSDRSRDPNEAKPGPAGAGVGGGLTQAELHIALRSLANRSLVVPDQEEKAFVLVPMVSEFLRRRKPEVMAETAEHLEARVLAMVTENGYREYDRFPVLESNWPTVAAALPQIAGGPNDQLQLLCRALQVFLDFSGRWDEKLALSADAEGKAVAADDRSSAGWRAIDGGWIYYLRKQRQQLVDCADRAEAHWSEVPMDGEQQADVIRLRGVAHELDRNLPAAADAYRTAATLWRTLNAEHKDLPAVLNDLAGVEMDLKDYEGAARDYREGLRMAQARNAVEDIACITGNMAGLALALENWAEAETLAREALRLSAGIGRQELIAEDNRRLAIALVRQDRKAEALSYARRAVEIYSLLHSPDLERAEQTLKSCGVTSDERA